MSGAIKNLEENGLQGISPTCSAGLQTFQKINPGKTAGSQTSLAEYDVLGHHLVDLE